MDPVTLALFLVKNVANSAAKATINQENCALLAELAGQTTPMLQQLEHLPVDDPILLKVLELLADALEQAQKAIEVCGKCSYFVGLLWGSKHVQMLKDAATKLEFALSQLPLASIGLAAETHDCIVSLKEELHNARFREIGSAARQTALLKEGMDNAFYGQRRVAEDTKCMIREMLQEHSQKTEEKLKDLEILKQYAADAQKAKNEQEEYELAELIDVISESLKDEKASNDSTQFLENYLCCPISKEIMKDPVMLKDSGITYDRSSIAEWMRRGHQRDPMTKTELRSRELIPNWRLGNCASWSCNSLELIYLLCLKQRKHTWALSRGCMKDMAGKQMISGMSILSFWS